MYLGSKSDISGNFKTSHKDTQLRRKIYVVTPYTKCLRAIPLNIQILM